MKLTKQEFYKRGGLGNPGQYRVKKKGVWLYYCKSKNQLKVKDRRSAKHMEIL